MTIYRVSNAPSEVPARPPEPRHAVLGNTARSMPARENSASRAFLVGMDPHDRPGNQARRGARREHEAEFTSPDALQERPRSSDLVHQTVARCWL